MGTKVHFNGESEVRNKLRLVTMDEKIQQTKEFEAWKGVGNRFSIVGDPSKVHGVKGLNILYRLLYWKVVINPAYDFYVLSSSHLLDKIVIVITRTTEKGIDCDCCYIYIAAIQMSSTINTELAIFALGQVHCSTPISVPKLGFVKILPA
jgi:hypothetical protein